jgi:hypothetical protein
MAGKFSLQWAYKLQSCLSVNKMPSPNGFLHWQGTSHLNKRAVPMPGYVYVPFTNRSYMPYNL